jgi:hypothetical protein
VHGRARSSVPRLRKVRGCISAGSAFRYLRLTHLRYCLNYYCRAILTNRTELGVSWGAVCEKQFQMTSTDVSELKEGAAGGRPWSAQGLGLSWSKEAEGPAHDAAASAQPATSAPTLVLLKASRLQLASAPAAPGPAQPKSVHASASSSSLPSDSAGRINDSVRVYVHDMGPGLEKVRAIRPCFSGFSGSQRRRK